MTEEDFLILKTKCDKVEQIMKAIKYHEEKISTLKDLIAGKYDYDYDENDYLKDYKQITFSVNFFNENANCFQPNHTRSVTVDFPEDYKQELLKVFLNRFEIELNNLKIQLKNIE